MKTPLVSVAIIEQNVDPDFGHRVDQVAPDFRHLVQRTLRLLADRAQAARFVHVFLPEVEQKLRQGAWVFHDDHVTAPRQDLQNEERSVDSTEWRQR